MKQKGFSLIELMIVIGIIGILALLATPIYQNYLIRVRLTLLIKESMEFYNNIHREFIVNNKEADATFGMIKGLCLDGFPITEGTDSVGSPTIKCTTSSIFSNETQRNITGLPRFEATVGSSYTVIYYGGNNGYDRIYAYFRNNSNEQDYTIFLDKSNVEYYSGQKGREMTMEFVRYDDSTSPRFGTHIIKKGETTPVLAPQGPWYCGFVVSDHFTYYYAPPSSAAPSVCKYTKLYNTGHYVEM